MDTTQRILKKLKIESKNAGACIGGGEWFSGVEKKTSINPSSEENIASITLCDASTYDKIVVAATESFKSWQMVPAPVRGEFIRQMGEALRKEKDALGSLVSLEMGKSKTEGDGEVQEMIDIADFAVGLSRQLYGLTMHSERPLHRMYEQWHPLGPVGVISAFNFPVAVWAWNAFIAAVCGDTVIWKPSLKTPLCAVAVQHICNDVLKRNGYVGIFNLCAGSQREVGEPMVNDRRLPLISATGSTKMGRDVAQRVALRLGRSLLELGGNNAVIVDETADLKLAIPAIVFGAIGTAGQRCTSTRRVLVHYSMFKEVKNHLIQIYRQLRIGDPLDPNMHMGPLIDAQAVEAFQHALEFAEKEGGRILHGGNILKRKGHFVEPTIVEAKAHFSIVQEETFAPIMYLISYDTFDEAMHINNSVPQGLSSALFSDSLRNTEAFLSHRGSDCGIANINIGTSGAEIGGAFGGEKDTGGGREAGSDVWKTYMRRQTNTINWGNTLPLAQGIKFDI